MGTILAGMGRRLRERIYFDVTLALDLQMSEVLCSCSHSFYPGREPQENEVESTCDMSSLSLVFPLL